MRGGYIPDFRVGNAALRVSADAFAARMAPILAEQQSRKISLNRMAAELNARGVLASRRGIWTATTVRRVLARLQNNS